MSELKAHDLVEIQDYRGEVYLKSEADKVIAERKEKYNELAKLYDKAIQACCDADKVIAGLKEERRWRKCSEELPSHDTWCIVYHEGEIDADHYTDDCNSHDRFVMYGPFVTHWMPLPKAPEE